jgi:competence protein ComGC
MDIKKIIVNNSGFTLIETALVLLLAMIITSAILPLVATHQKNAICKSFGNEITSVINAAVNYYNVYNTVPTDGTELMSKNYLGERKNLWGIYKFIYNAEDRRENHYFQVQLTGTEELRNANLLNRDTDIGYCLSDNNQWINFPANYAGGDYIITVPLKVAYGHIDLTGLSDKTFLYGETYDFVRNNCVIGDNPTPGCSTIGVWDEVEEYKDPNDAIVEYRSHSDYQRPLPSPKEMFYDYSDADSPLYNGW